MRGGKSVLLARHHADETTEAKPHKVRYYLERRDPEFEPYHYEPPRRPRGLIERVRFALDSLLEGAGFEPSVPGDRLPINDAQVPSCGCGHRSLGGGLGN
jgi:hypothetical protein